ncbi:uncharacterized protein [Engystomops pustulosus]|uniref:uncharacterized protein n=1 Tax=Engystomops pustulosus TaxID=76066 RepID=UPI003AFA95C6
MLLRVFLILIILLASATGAPTRKYDHKAVTKAGKGIAPSTPSPRPLPPPTTRPPIITKKGIGPSTPLRRPLPPPTSRPPTIGKGIAPSTPSRRPLPPPTSRPPTIGKGIAPSTPSPRPLSPPTSRPPIIGKGVTPSTPSHRHLSSPSASRPPTTIRKGERPSHSPRLLAPPSKSLHPTKIMEKSSGATSIILKKLFTYTFTLVSSFKAITSMVKELFNTKISLIVVISIIVSLSMICAIIYFVRKKLKERKKSQDDVETGQIKQETTQVIEEVETPSTHSPLPPPISSRSLTIDIEKTPLPKTVPLIAININMPPQK